MSVSSLRGPIRSYRKSNWLKIRAKALVTCQGCEVMGRQNQPSDCLLSWPGDFVDRGNWKRVEESSSGVACEIRKRKRTLIAL